MLNSQRGVAIALRLTAIVVLLPQAREIGRSLRPRCTRDRREDEGVQQNSHAGVFELRVLTHSQSNSSRPGDFSPRRAETVAGLRIQIAARAESRAAFPSPPE